MIIPFDTLLIALVVGVSSGIVGSFIILKRMALVGDALSHVALPGIALMLAYGLDPFWGVLSFLLGAAVIVWWLESKTALPSEVLVGLLFTASLAIGILTIPDHEVLESLFGTFPSLTTAESLLILGGGVVVTFLAILLTRRFLFTIISPELSQVEYKGKARKYDLLLLLIFSFVVALGIKLVGTLLMGALTIIPASIAKNVTRSMSGFMLMSGALGAFIAVFGVLIAEYFGFLPGPAIILSGIGLFLVSLFLMRK